MNVEIGRTYYTGNSLHPTKRTVKALTTWEALPQRIHQIAKHISRDFERVDGAVWVRTYTPANRRGSRVQYLPVGVFAATSYHTHEEMIRAYTR